LFLVKFFAKYRINLSPIPTTLIVTVTEAATIFLQYLVEIASDFLGKPIVGAVLAVPPYFTQNQRERLLKAAEGVGVGVLQLVEAVGAVASATTAEACTSGGDLAADRVQLAVDLGVSSLSLALVAHHGGLAHVLCSSVHFDACGREIDTTSPHLPALSWPSLSSCRTPDRAFGDDVVHA
jgi:molecular chaperone DnaK (HSP70)